LPHSILDNNSMCTNYNDRSIARFTWFSLKRWASSCQFRSFEGWASSCHYTDITGIKGQSLRSLQREWEREQKCCPSRVLSLRLQTLIDEMWVAWNDCPRLPLCGGYIIMAQDESKSGCFASWGQCRPTVQVVRYRFHTGLKIMIRGMKKVLLVQSDGHWACYVFYGMVGQM
jgi:hypothetical protein